MVKKYAELYLDARRALLPTEGQFASNVARELICAASGKTAEQLISDRDLYASEEICELAQSFVRRRVAGEPMPYILGEWDFYGMTLTVTPDVLIPRDDTMAVTELAIKKALFLEQNPRILDLCTGSGCIGLAILLGYFLLVSLPCPDGLSPNGKRAIAMMFAAVLIWVFEILPVAVASVLFAVLPAVAGILPLPKMMQLFATPTIFFVFAMFCIAIAFQNSGLSRRIVLWTSLRSKGSPVRLLLLLMMVCALLSTILADIPVVAMMLPVAVLLLEKNGCVKGTSNFGKAVMLGLPIACLIGGVGTPAGSAMNMLTISLLQSTADVHIGFFEWTAIGMPMVLVLTPLAWWLVIRAFPPEIGRLAGMDLVEREYAGLGGLGRRESVFIAVLAVNFILWSTEKLHGIPLPVAAVIGCAIFSLPAVELLTWEQDKGRIGWDSLMLIGASNALGMAIWETGGAAWIAHACLGGVAGMPLAGVIAVISLFTVVIHLLIPVNTAIVAVLLPALAALAGTMGVNPAVLAIPMGFSVSAAFLLPLDAVPLVTYPAGYYRMFDMFKPGCLISVVWVVVMTLVMFAIAVPLGLL